MTDLYISKEGYKKLKNDLAKLNRQKIEIAQEIGEAMEQGDLKENAGYTAAKEKQALVLERIAETETKLQSAKITDELKIDKNTARIGATVTMVDADSKETHVYTLVSSDEAEPLEGKISIDSPIAQGLLGAKKDSKVKIQLPNAEMEFLIIGIEYK
ncbi:MAG: transcription elongation factor GreA [Elusimicrobiales bacterium]|nr:transcription elongation factor GreA [Elusimicrobiales bacterium]